METRRVANVVIGAGAMGSATAYHLAKRGEPVVLVEQFAVGHDRGSSHGSARITRYSYADIRYARLMIEAFRAWRELEADAGQNLYLRTGGVSLCPPGVDYVAQVAANLAEIGVAHRRMTAAALAKALPMFQAPGDTDVVFEPDAGMLAAGRIVKMHVALAHEFGGDETETLENLAVRRIDLEGDKPVVVSDRLILVADRLIVTAGAWVNRLVPSWSPKLQPTRQQVLYFRPTDPAPFTPGRLPTFIYKGFENHDSYYGMPAHDGLGVKVARHDGPVTDPDKPDAVVSREYQSIVRGFLRNSLPALAEAPIDRTEVCLYTMAPEENFQIGWVCGRNDVIAASPCSGHGFKFSCLIGRVLADLATLGKTEIAVETWLVS